MARTHQNSLNGARIAFSGLCLACVLLLGGCAVGNGYSQFYTQREGASPDAIAATRVAPPTGSPQVVRAGHFDESIYARQGFDLIGHSSFTSGHDEPEANAVAQGVSVGADLVLILSPAYERTVSTEVPITTPTRTTSNTNGTATAYGSGGSVTAYGTSTTTTYGSKTTYMPLTVDRYEYNALYFIKRKYRLGANFRDLNDGERQALQTNRGVYVLSVVDGSPAYESDILPGDVVVGVNGQPTNGAAGMSDLLSAYAGQQVDFSIVRRGEKLSKRVALRE